MKSHIVTTKIGSIEYCIVGHGKPILLLHGGHSSCKERLGLTGFDLSKYQFIIPSRPGYGRTPLQESTSPKLAAELMAALLDELSISDVVVYGISAAGPTAIEFATNYPEKTSKLILASAVSKQWLQKNEFTYKMAQIMFSPKRERYTWKLIRSMSRLFPRLIAKNFQAQFSTKPLEELDNSTINKLIKTLIHYSSGSGFLNDIDQQISKQTIQAVNCKTLIIHSEYDNSVSVDHARYAHQLIPNASLVILQNDWGHLIWLGHDNQVAFKHLEDFLEG